MPTPAEWSFDHWVIKRDALRHVRIVYDDLAALELDEEDWRDVKEVLDAEAEASPA